MSVNPSKLTGSCLEVCLTQYEFSHLLEPHFCHQDKYPDIKQGWGWKGFVGLIAPELQKWELQTGIFNHVYSRTQRE